jgi:superfamily II DNA or RNA helicase
MILWECQDRTLAAIDTAVNAGQKRICVTLPTGGGKTVIMGETTRRMSVPTILYHESANATRANFVRMEAFGIDHGIRASGVDPALLKDVQVSSIMTEESRVFAGEMGTARGEAGARSTRPTTRPGTSPRKS